ncbi:hypothetical protein KDL01_03380 [Actinospica durhamensis]|uniref:BACON domain-containing protein n=1 Tax=Actinospica durhamensis TaxID=1508375 RepID=A0A941ENH7_9ACTN|nr:BACON domain-containing carbohydrate-binding protein [Actinospica durhamensis]MBR7832284.1 hypothetical protein [Actinospica durhamensis]
MLGGTAGDGWGRAAAYDAYADGLHTYGLWYLRDHDAAADAVYCAFVAADRNHTTLQQPEQIQPWLYALLRRECRLRAAEPDSPTPASGRLRPKADGLGDSGVGASLLQLEGNLRRAEFHSLAWPDAEGLAPAHREVLELTIRHGLDSRGLALVLGLREGAAGLASTRGFGLLADAWRELERSLAAAAVAGSGRDNCAQLAELTFGWSGRLNATLRAPLTEHVDRCSRCQHYLHTVIGTPSAPTILPFVAAPRALRDMLLGELSDTDAAAAAGVDLVALGRRCGSFGPEGFPARVDLSYHSATAAGGTAAAGTGAAGTGAGSVRPPRRRQASARPHRAPRVSPAADVPTKGAGDARRPQPVDDAARSGGQQEAAQTRARVEAASRPGSQPQQQPLPQAQSQPQSQPQPFPEPRPTSSLTPMPGTRSTPRPPDAEDLFRASGSWAERVLPPRGGLGQRSEETGLWRPEPPAVERAAGFVQTASGRFATRLPLLPPLNPSRPSNPQNPANPTAPTPPTAAPDATGVDAAATASEPAKARRAHPGANRLPRYARNGGGSAGARARHKARPMRQAVVSAMALGAIGAVAAAAAALLGAGGDPHTNAAALDNTQPNEVVGGVGTPSAAGSASRSALSVTVATNGGGADRSAGLGLPGSPLGTGSSPAGAASPTAAAAGGFYVSVNERDGDPYSVQILLRNAGTAPLDWSAAPSVSWLTLSQRSGTLAPGQSLSVTATATSAAPSGQWTAQITFQPGGIVVTVHGGVAAASSSTPTVVPSGASSSSTSGTSGASSSPSTSASASASASASPSAGATTAPTGSASTSSGTSAAPASASASAATSASSASASASAGSPSASAPVHHPRHSRTR